MSEVHAVESPAITVRAACYGGDWTTEREEMLTQLCEAKESWTVIARKINDATGSSFTRSATKAKAKRFGLFKAPAIVERPEPKRKRKPKAETVAVTVEPQPVVIPAAPIERCTFENLKAKHCRWPFGTPGTADFYFCGGDRVPTRPYCIFHSRLAYLPPSRRAGT